MSSILDHFDSYDFPSPSQRVHKTNLNTVISRLDEICGATQVGSPGAVLDEMNIIDPAQRSLYTNARAEIVRCRTSPPRLSYTDRMLQLAATVGAGLFAAIFAYGYTQSDHATTVGSLLGSMGACYVIGSVLLKEAAETKRLRGPRLEDAIKRKYFHQIIDPAYQLPEPTNDSESDSVWEA